MINKSEARFENIISATCDCCNEPIKVQFGTIDDHVKIEGYRNGKNLEAIICLKCVDEKLGSIKITEKVNTIGYC